MTRVSTQDLPVVRLLVRSFDIDVGQCFQCRRRVQGRHPLQTSEALGVASVQLEVVLQAGLALRDRRDDGPQTDHGLGLGLASVRGRLLARRGRLTDAPAPLDDTERFAAHLDTEFAAVFAFLWDPSVNATNWRAEQAIRPAVITRKVCGGNRTRHGADTQQVLASVVRTAHQRNLDLAPLIATMLRATNPIVPDRLQRPPPYPKS